MMMMTNQQATNLLNVATALRDSLQPEKFTMNRFANFRWDKFFSRFDKHTDVKDERVIAACGSPACALGHYAARNDLQNTFYLDYDTNAIRSIRFNRPLQLNGHLVRREFGISCMEAEELFGGIGCDNALSPNAAANYIENFLYNKGWVTA